MPQGSCRSRAPREIQGGIGFARRDRQNFIPIPMANRRTPRKPVNRPSRAKPSSTNLIAHRETHRKPAHWVETIKLSPTHLERAASETAF